MTAKIAAWAEWKKYVNDPVQIVTEKGSEIFPNLKAAQRKYPTLDPNKNTRDFTWAMHGMVKGRDAIRFESWEIDKMLSRSARFEQGKSVDVPKYLEEHGNPEAAKKWEDMNEEYGDLLKTAGSEIAKTILEQMGGQRRLQAMLGVQRFIALPKGVFFQWPNRQRSKGNAVEITLNSMDLYDMKFLNVAGGSKKVIREIDGVYFDQLVDIFEKQTGWYLRIANQEKTAASDIVYVSVIAKNPTGYARGKEFKFPWESKDGDLVSCCPYAGVVQDFKSSKSLNQIEEKKGYLREVVYTVKRPSDLGDIRGWEKDIKAFLREPGKSEVEILKQPREPQIWLNGKPVKREDMRQAGLWDRKPMDERWAEELESRFEEGVPADPTKNMSPEDKKKWNKQKELHKDQFKKAIDEFEILQSLDRDSFSKMSAVDMKMDSDDYIDDYILRGDKDQDVQGFMKAYKDNTGHPLRHGDSLATWKKGLVKEDQKEFDSWLKEHQKPNKNAGLWDRKPMDERWAEELESRFEEGKPADPTKNMSPEDKKKWNKQKELHKEQFKKAETPTPNLVWDKAYRHDDGTMQIDGLVLAFDEDAAANYLKKQADAKGKNKPEIDTEDVADTKDTTPEQLDGAFKQLSEALKNTALPTAEGKYRTRVEPSEFMLEGSDEENWHFKHQVSLNLLYVNKETGNIIIPTGEAEDLGGSFDKMAAKAPSGLYGYTRRIQSDCEGCIQRSSRIAKRLATTAWKKDANVAPFLAAHAKRANSIPAKILVEAMKDLGPKVATMIEETQDSKTAGRNGLYGFRLKTANLGMKVCSQLRQEIGHYATDLHNRRSEHHANIIGFFKQHSKEAKCLYSQILYSSYPEMVKKASVPKSVQDWIDFDIT